MSADEREKALARTKKLKAIRETLTNFQIRCYKELNSMPTPEMYFRGKWPKAQYLEIMIDKATEAGFLATQESVKIRMEFG